MKKIIALALALIMALSLGSVAFAATTNAAAGDTTIDVSAQLEVNGTYAPGSTLTITHNTWVADALAGQKLSYSFTKGGAMVESIKYNKAKTAILVELKENFPSLN